MKKSTENLSLTLSVYEADSAKIGIVPYLVVVKLSAYIQGSAQKQSKDMGDRKGTKGEGIQRKDTIKA